MRELIKNKGYNKILLCISYLPKHYSLKFQTYNSIKEERENERTN